MFSDAKVERDLPLLQQKLKDLLGAVCDIPGKNYSFDDADHFAFMLLAFLAKQKEHARSVACLTLAGHGRDAGLVVRSMLEGLTQLKWAAQDLEARPFRWRAFTYICDWRKINEILQEGGSVSPDVISKTHDAIAQFGERFWTKQARQCHEAGKPLPKDPYNKSWLGGGGYTRLFAEVEAHILRKNIYSPYSAWHHWSPEGMGAALHRSTAKISYSPPSARDSALALATCFQSLVEVAQATDSYLELGFETTLQSLVDDYVRSIRRSN